MKKVALNLLALPLVCVFVACSSSPEGTTDGDCMDKKDNDSNGLVDCEDSGCNLDDYCIALAAKAIVAADKLTKKLQPPQPVAQEDDKEYIELEDIWVQKGHNGEDISQPASIRYCEGLKLVGKSDWRLPNETEAAVAAKSEKLPQEALVMWTSTTKSKKRAAIVGISTGAINELGVHSQGQCRARCVRDK